jgi:hypothetical protein
MRNRNRRAVSSGFWVQELAETDDNGDPILRL